jgi:hypothetical protein
LLTAVGLAGAVRDACRPHKSDYDRTVRELVQAFWTRVEPGDAVVLGNPAGAVPMVAEWYLRHQRADVCRPDSPQLAIPARGSVWRWFFSAHAPEPSAALWVMGARGQGLTVVENESWMLLSDSPGDPPPLLHAVPAGARDLYEFSCLRGDRPGVHDHELNWNCSNLTRTKSRICCIRTCQPARAASTLSEHAKFTRFRISSSWLDTLSRSFAIASTGGTATRLSVADTSAVSPCVRDNAERT